MTWTHEKGWSSRVIKVGKGRHVTFAALQPAGASDKRVKLFWDRLGELDTGEDEDFGTAAVMNARREIEHRMRSGSAMCEENIVFCGLFEGDYGGLMAVGECTTKKSHLAVEAYISLVGNTVAWSKDPKVASMRKLMKARKIPGPCTHLMEGFTVCVDARAGAKPAMFYLTNCGGGAGCMCYVRAAKRAGMVVYRGDNGDATNRNKKLETIDTDTCVEATDKSCVKLVWMRPTTLERIRKPLSDKSLGNALQQGDMSAAEALLKGVSAKKRAAAQAQAIADLVRKDAAMGREDVEASLYSALSFFKDASKPFVRVEKVGDRYYVAVKQGDGPVPWDKASLGKGLTLSKLPKDLVEYEFQSSTETVFASFSLQGKRLVRMYTQILPGQSVLRVGYVNTDEKKKGVERASKLLSWGMDLVGVTTVFGDMVYRKKNLYTVLAKLRKSECVMTMPSMFGESLEYLASHARLEKPRDERRRTISMQAVFDARDIKKYKTMHRGLRAPGKAEKVAEKGFRQDKRGLVHMASDYLPDDALVEIFLRLGSSASPGLVDRVFENLIAKRRDSVARALSWSGKVK